jgi:SNF2 family DNA or RNA helicase
MSVTVTTDGKRIMADIPWMNGQGRELAKKVPGRRPVWDKTVTPNKFKYWTYPLTMTTCRILRQVFGAELEILPPLVQWARKELDREAELEAVRTGVAVSLEHLRDRAPDLALAMDARPYQPAGASFIRTAGQCCLGDQPGLGKTLQTLGALIDSGARNILVACPRTATRSVWQRETWRWAPTIRPIVAQGTRQQRENAITAWLADDSPQRMLVINLEMIRAKRIWVCKGGEFKGDQWSKPPGRKGGCYGMHEHDTEFEYEWPWLMSQEWDAIVMDESHKVLASMYNVQSKNITQSRLGAMHLRKRLIDDGTALALSGTPFRSSLVKAWGTLNWLRPDVFSSFWQFAESHFDVEEDHWGKKTIAKDPRDPDAFNAALRPYYLARTKENVAKDLPPVVYAGTPPEGNADGLNGIWLDMDPKQQKAYDAMKKEGLARLDDGSILANGVLAEITRLRQFACSYGTAKGNHFTPTFPSNKFDWLEQFLDERIGAGGKVVVASSFTQLIDMFSAKLTASGVKNLTLTGATNDRKRAELVSRFADPDDEYRVAVINTQAGGVAITLDQADDMVIVDMPWTADDEQQLIDRIHRVSRIHEVTVWRLFSTGTVDEWLASLTEVQRETLRVAKQDNTPNLRGAFR